MNTGLTAIIKRIIAEQGESILDDPQRLKGFVHDYAKNEPKEDRVAFGRCIEMGAYTGLKNAHTREERRQVKAAFLPHIQAASGFSAAQCADALDVLEAALFGIPAPAPPQRAPPAPQPVYTPPPVYAAPSAPPVYASPPAKKHVLRNVLIAVVLVAVAAGALVNVSTSWRGYSSFESFSRAANIDEFLGEPVTEETFKLLMGFATFAYYFSGGKLENYENIELDIVSGEKLTERYGVSRELRANNSYLIKRDVITATGRIAYFNDDVWVVLSVKKNN
jgi:hypothetical protein